MLRTTLVHSGRLVHNAHCTISTTVCAVTYTIVQPLTHSIRTVAAVRDGTTITAIASERFLLPSSLSIFVGVVCARCSLTGTHNTRALTHTHTATDNRTHTHTNTYVYVHVHVCGCFVQCFARVCVSILFRSDCIMYCSCAVWLRVYVCVVCCVLLCDFFVCSSHLLLFDFSFLLLFRSILSAFFLIIFGLASVCVCAAVLVWFQCVL